MKTVSFGILSTYPPTQCGLATFSEALVGALRVRDVAGVIRVVEPGDELVSSALVSYGVDGHWVRGAAEGWAAAAGWLSSHDVAVIQHEYGIYGGRDGQDVVPVVRALEVPAIVVLHTVPSNPSVRQRAILEELADLCGAVVTMTQTARRRLSDRYTVDPGKIRVIPHGAVDNRGNDPQRAGDPRQVLTWGLLGEGKGIEWAIEAMALLRDLRPPPWYSVVGQTHPRVLQRQGERYRDALASRVRQFGVQDSVRFDARYLSEPDLRKTIRQADVVLLPYDSLDQVTSGVLIEAIAAGKPVISTDFPHARELLSTGAGLLVARKDPAAIADALRQVLTEPDLRAAMAAEACRLAPRVLWPAVAAQYRQVALDVLGVDPPLTAAALATA